MRATLKLENFSNESESCLDRQVTKQEASEDLPRCNTVFEDQHNSDTKPNNIRCDTVYIDQSGTDHKLNESGDIIEEELRFVQMFC